MIARETHPPVRDFMWRGGDFLDGLDLAAADDPAAELEALRGHFAHAQETAAGECWLARDPLGVNKLFFAVEDGGLRHSNRLRDLLSAGHALDQVYSVPSGHFVHAVPAERRLTLTRYATIPWGGSGASLEDHAAVIRARLTQAFDGLVSAVGGRPLYVTLSGGLDSSLIAVLAKERFPGLQAVTFHLGERDDDLQAAERVAAELEIPLLRVPVDPEALVDGLDEALVGGQDWRDFNVHCALVNVHLARFIAARHPDGARPIVLTGDTMNELMSDYSPVEYGGRTFYELPRLELGRLRRFLVAGLDSGDREVGVFADRGIDTIQPYALCADAYGALPDALIAQSGAKAALVRAVAGGRVPDFVGERPKVRAQVGNTNGAGGVLAELIDRGIDGPALRQRFAELHGLDPAELDTAIRAGFYRFTNTFPRTP